VDREREESELRMSQLRPAAVARCMADDPIDTSTAVNIVRFSRRKYNDRELPSLYIESYLNVLRKLLMYSLLISFIVTAMFRI